jgi:conjugative transfer region protein (TIGR03750 family)
MSETTVAFLPDRLNGEPVVYRGLTTRELALLAAAAVAVWLPVSLLILGLAGLFMMGIGMAALLALGTVWITSGWIQAVKRGKPDGYHVLRFELLLHDLKLRRSPYIRYSGLWDIRRRRSLRDAVRPTSKETSE